MYVMARLRLWCDCRLHPTPSALATARLTLTSHQVRTGTNLSGFPMQSGLGGQAMRRGSGKIEATSGKLVAFMRRVLTSLLLSACSAVAQTYETCETKVTPLPEENLSAPCDYEMLGMESFRAGTLQGGLGVSGNG